MLAGEISDDQACSAYELATQAMEQASRRIDRRFLDVAYPASDVPLDIDTRYQVDLESRSIGRTKRSRPRPDRTQPGLFTRRGGAPFCQRPPALMPARRPAPCPLVDPVSRRPRRMRRRLAPGAL